MPVVVEANTLAFRAGYNFGETAEIFESSYEIAPAEHLPGTYTNVTGNAALAWGLLAAAHLAKLPLFLGSYPITPASDILHELSKHKNFGVRTLQAEDEIAGIGAALGAAFGGALGVTTTSGPGIDLKAETVGLAVSLELPLLIVDIQRGGPSTGLPTKTEQSDLLHAMFGRHGEAPVADRGRQDARRTASRPRSRRRASPLRYRTPVYLLSDGYLANGSEPWRLPDVESLPDISVEFATEPNATDADGEPAFWPYLRDPGDARPAVGDPGHAGPRAPHRRAREAATASGRSPTSPRTTRRWSTLRAAKIAGIAKDLPPVEADDPTGDARVLAARLGLDLRGHHGRGQAGAQARQAGGAGAPRPPEPVPAEPRRGAPLLRGDPRPGGQPRPPDPPRALGVPRRREGAVAGAGTPFRVGEIERAILQEIDRVESGAGKDAR